jgi:tRNA-dihydrouridine synthase B
MGVVGNIECDSGNATEPSPAIAPGSEGIDPRRAAEDLLRRFEGAAIDPRVTALVPGFDGPFFQAGLCGYSDAAMRIIARRHGCPFCVTEALLDRTLLAGGRGFAKADLGDIEDNVPGGDEDHPLAGQIMGSDPAEMAAAALKMVEQGARADKEYRRLAYAVDGVLPSTHAAAGQHLRLPGGVQVGRYEPLAELEADAAANTERRRTSSEQERRGTSAVPCPLSPVHSFEAIDVNLACPVKKIDRKARGGHWLMHPEGAVALLEAVREAVPPQIPCTVKLRRAYDDTPEMAENFERILTAAWDIGYAWATVHGRTVEQKYIGPSRWDILREIVHRHPDRLIFGSGDIWQAADIFRMIAYTGVVGVSVARGCIGNPWIFRQARGILAGREARRPTIPEQRTVLEDHFKLALRVNSIHAASPARMRHAEAFTGKTMRKFGIRFAAHHPRGEEVRREMIAVSSLADWQGVLDRHYRTPTTGC